MARILCIETATEVCSVGLAVDGQPEALAEVHEGYSHASQITLLIEEVMRQGGLKLTQLDAVAVSMGPGSYTGLRVGVSTAKGLCYTLHKPLIAVNSLHALAYHYKLQHPESTSLLIPMIDARRMEVYACVLQSDGTELRPTAAVIIQPDSFQDLFQQQPVALIGNGAGKCQSVFTHPNAIFPEPIHCSASGMCLLAEDRVSKNLVEDVAYFEPFYLKDFVGTTPKK